MIGAATWPEAAVWIAVIAAITTIFSILIWQLGRCLAEYIRQESESGRATKLAAQSERKP